MSNPVIRHIADSVQALLPYQPGRPIAEVAHERGIPHVIKLASNENPLGPGKAALRTIQSMSAESLSRYPDSNSGNLRAALAEHLQIPPESLLFGNGSNEILELAAQLLLAEGLAAVYSRHAFVVYGLAVAARRASSRIAPTVHYTHDLPAMAKLAQAPDVRLIFIANPNNPTGTWHPLAHIADFMRQIPADKLVIVDEAYCEYADGEGALSLLAAYPNLLIARTFSKIHGLAGLRAGYAIGAPELIEMFNRVRQPFNLSTVAAAAAVAALGDEAHVVRSRKINDAGMEQIGAGLRELGLSAMPSRGNFITFAIPDADGLYQKLLSVGVIVRPLAGYELPNWLRVSIGTEEENARFLQALQQGLD